jgi:hypothetical protein
VTYGKKRGPRKKVNLRLPMWLYQWFNDAAYGRDVSLNVAIVDALSKHARNSGAKLGPTMDKPSRVQ